MTAKKPVPRKPIHPNASEMSIEEQLASPVSRRKSGSFAAMVYDLEPGESASRVGRVNPDKPLADLVDDLPKLRDTLRNNCAPAVRGAKIADPDREYAIEVGEMLTPAGRLYVVAIVTRLV